MSDTSWYGHLDEVKTDLDALVTAGQFPKTHVEVTPAPPEPVDALKRMGRRTSTQVYLSIAGLADAGLANSPDATLACVAHVYTRDGHTAKHGSKIERNRLAAMIAEQIHVLLRDPTQYQIDAPGDRAWQMGRGDNIRVRNLSFAGGKSSADTNQLAHWVLTWDAVMRSEAMNPATLADLTRIDVVVAGTEFGGDDPDPLDDEQTRVVYP